jgi:hypothetical protein
MPCRMCAHYLPTPRESDQGWCRLKSDSTNLPFPTRASDLCEFFELDPNSTEDLQMVLCRHCGGVAFVGGEIELCAECSEKFNLQQFFRDEGYRVDGLMRFNCSRPYRERWLKQRLEVKQGGKLA